jgi:hypothetical protein
MSTSHEIVGAETMSELRTNLSQLEIGNESFELGFHSTVYDDFIATNEISISPRDKLSFIDDKKPWKENTKFLESSKTLNHLTRMLQTEIVRCKPDDILAFINDEFFSLENQTKLRQVLQD